MPRIWYEKGFSFSFFAADGTEPPHVHVRKQGAKAKWWLDPPREASNHGFNARDRAIAGAIVTARRRELLQSWNDIFPPTGE